MNEPMSAYSNIIMIAVSRASVKHKRVNMLRRNGKTMALIPSPFPHAPVLPSPVPHVPP